MDESTGPTEPKAPGESAGASEAPNSDNLAEAAGNSAPEAPGSEAAPGDSALDQLAEGGKPSRPGSFTIRLQSLPKSESGRIRITYGYLAKNLVSLMGISGMVIFGLMLLFLSMLDLLGFFRDGSPYTGLITYVLVPALLTASFFFTLLGMAWRWWRSKKRGIRFEVVPGHTRKTKVAVVAMAIFVTLTWVMGTSFGTYRAYHYMESNEFCGLACHQVMEPEYVAAKISPHSRVHCVECHIGPGADYFVKAKYRGLQQLWISYSDEAHTPIKTPIDSIRSAREICGQCHWPDRSIENVERVFVHYAQDDENTKVQYNLMMKVGGGPMKSHGAHWHASEQLEVHYLARDEERQDIPYVRVKQPDGKIEEYMEEGFDRSTIVESELRLMSCLDCHNRPAHRFLSPSRAVNEAMHQEDISPNLPGIKKVAMDALKGDYKTRDEAFTAIDKALDDYVKAKKLTPEQRDLLPKTRENLKEIYAKRFFPEHGVDYRAFFDNMGHFEYKGCDRCHDGNHKSANGGEPITHDCNACHTIIAQSTGEEEDKPNGKVNYKAVKFEHPEDPVNLKKSCNSCHGIKKDK